MPTINMRSSATMVKGQGVGSCYEEQVRLVTEGLTDAFTVYINRHKRSDIVHYHTINPQYFVERLLNRRKTAGIGYVHFLPDTLENSISLPDFARQVFYKYVLNFYNSMDYLVTVNPGVAEKLRFYGVTRPRIIYIPNYVSEEMFFPQDADSIAEMRAHYGIADDAFVVLGVGQLQTRKGIADFVATARRLPQVQFVWVGGFSFGKISDGYDDIKALIKNAPKNVRFTGLVEREEMPDWYNMANLLFLPSYDELFPMSILEAVACKLPLLLRDIDVYPPILFDHYMKAKQVGAFAQLIDGLCKDETALNEWRNRSLECHKLYSRANVLKMWERLYNDAYHSIRNAKLVIM